MDQEIYEFDSFDFDEKDKNHGITLRELWNIKLEKEKNMQREEIPPDAILTGIRENKYGAQPMYIVTAKHSAHGTEEIECKLDSVQVNAFINKGNYTTNFKEEFCYLCEL